MATKKAKKPAAKRGKTAAAAGASPREPAPQTPPDPMAWRRVGRLQLAELIGVHADTVTDYARAGMPTVTRGGAGKEGVYDAVDCLAWWRLRQGPDAKEAAQARQATSRAVLNEIEIERARGALVPMEDVILAGQHFVKAWTAKVRGLPRQLVQAGLLPRSVEGQVADLLRHLLEEIASWQTVAQVKRAAAKAEKEAHADAR